MKRVRYEDASFQVFGVHKLFKIYYFGQFVGVLGKATEDSWWQVKFEDGKYIQHHFGLTHIKNHIRGYLDRKKLKGEI